MTPIRTLGFVIALAVACIAIALKSHPARAYQDSFPTINRPGADIADTYMFPSPTNSQNIVVVMTVHPLIKAGRGTKTYFDQSVLYQMKFDTAIGTQGHIPKEDVVIQFTVGPVTNNNQQIFVYGPARPAKVGTVNTLVGPSGSGQINKSFTAGNLTIRAGGFEDPAFYDRAQLLSIFPNRNKGSNAASCLQGGTPPCPHGFPNPGSDTQGGLNILAFVVEMPRSTLIGPNGNTRVACGEATSTETGS
jgi:Domain of unknown function (DUF4331)